jgi:hypothetical protein
MDDGRADLGPTYSCVELNNGGIPPGLGPEARHPEMDVEETRLRVSGRSKKTRTIRKASS